MKAILTTMVLASASALAQQAAPEPALKPGSEVKLEAVTSADWIQGEPLKAFEPGKVYMFECWATWCGPCITTIPRVNDLHKKYSEKGLRIYGMNVLEDGKDNVAKFVKEKGDGMSYPIAYTGKGSAFEKDWLMAGGVRGIPHAFIVKDGKLVLSSNPAYLTDSVIEALLAGDDQAKKAVEEINTAKSAQENLGKTMRDFGKATAANDVDTMAAKIAEMEKIQPDSPYIGPMKIDLLTAKKDWPAAAKALEELPEGQAKQMAVMMLSTKIATRPDGDFPKDFIAEVSKVFTGMLDDPKISGNPIGFVTLANLQWKGGDKDAAKAAAKKAVEASKTPPVGAPPGMKLPTAAFEKFSKALDEDRLPTTMEFTGWMREEMGAPAAGAMPPGNVQPAPAPAGK